MYIIQLLYLKNVDEKKESFNLENENNQLPNENLVGKKID